MPVDLEAIRKRNEKRRTREQWPQGEPLYRGDFKPFIQQESPETADIDDLLAEVERLNAVLVKLDNLHSCNKADIRSLISGITP